MFKNTSIIAALAAFLSIAPASARDWNFDASVKARTLYGYSNFDSSYSDRYSKNNLPTRFNLNLLAEYILTDGYQIGAYFDAAYGVDQQLKDYNHGVWGEQAYMVFDSPYGRLVGGQTYNAAYQLGVGAPDAGVLGVNQSDIVNFVANPNWQRNHRATSYRTLNSTEINTDGTAPKITYITPEFDGTMFGFTYVPESYSQDGLINRRASYRDEAGYIATVYHNIDFESFTVSGSLAAARFEDIDDELSGGLSLYYKGWTLGGSVRRTFVDHKDADMNVPNRYSIPYFDSYRDAWAYNAGIGYEIGPFKSSLTYFYSKADNRNFEDKIVQFSGTYQYDKQLELYAAVARGEFNAPTEQESNQGYAFIGGFGIKF